MLYTKKRKVKMLQSYMKESLGLILVIKSSGKHEGMANYNVLFIQANAFSPWLDSRKRGHIFCKASEVAGAASAEPNASITRKAEGSETQVKQTLFTSGISSILQISLERDKTITYFFKMYYKRYEDGDMSVYVRTVEQIGVVKQGNSLRIDVAGHFMARRQELRGPKESAKDFHLEDKVSSLGGGIDKIISMGWPE